MQTLEYARSIDEHLEHDKPMLFQVDCVELPSYPAIYPDYGVNSRAAPKTLDFEFRTPEGNTVTLFRACAEFSRVGNDAMLTKVYLKNMKTGTIWAVIVHYSYYHGGSQYRLEEYKSLQDILMGLFAHWDGSYSVFLTDLNFNWFHL